jgi:hypothetical protein
MAHPGVWFFIATETSWAYELRKATRRHAMHQTRFSRTPKLHTGQTFLGSTMREGALGC